MANTNLPAPKTKPAESSLKGTESFTRAISAYLTAQAAADPLFAETLKKPGKSIDNCITYILNQVKNSGCCGFEDSEIFGMAVHYYDEDDIKPGSPIKCNVVVNHQVQLTEEEIQQAKATAMERAISEEMNRIKKKAEPKKDQKAPVQQPLF